MTELTRKKLPRQQLIMFQNVIKLPEKKKNTLSLQIISIIKAANIILLWLKNSQKALHY